MSQRYTQQRGPQNRQNTDRAAGQQDGPQGQSYPSFDDDYEEGEDSNQSRYAGGRSSEWEGQRDSSGYGRRTGTSNGFGDRNAQNGSSSGGYGQGNDSDRNSRNRDTNGRNFQGSGLAGNRQDWQRSQDNTSAGSGQAKFRGVGPKGYERSDERLKELVCDRLADDDDIDASRIDVQISSGEVTLTGEVDSRWAKRHAEDLVEEVSGVKHCQNNLRVSQGEKNQRSDSSSDTATLAARPASKQQK